MEVTSCNKNEKWSWESADQRKKAFCRKQVVALRDDKPLSLSRTAKAGGSIRRAPRGGLELAFFCFLVRFSIRIRFKRL
ncbi:hypothetical protein Hdeb2414_s0306g00862461 [Helianthus debilis subsp. tardiflorus]